MIGALRSADINTKSNKAKAIVNSTFASAALGGVLQSGFCLFDYAKHSKLLKDDVALKNTFKKSAFRTIGSSALMSGLLALGLTTFLTIINTIKSKKQAKNN